MTSPAEIDFVHVYAETIQFHGARCGLSYARMAAAWLEVGSLALVDDGLPGATCVSIGCDWLK